MVTHRRPDELTKSLDALTTQSRALDHLIVVDNDDDERVRDLVAGQPVPTTYLGSRRNLGGAGGFALGMLHALALGADWIWLADDDGRPQDADVLATLLACADRHALAEVSPMVCNLDDPDRLAFPLRRGLVWRRLVSELRTEGAGQDLLPGIASLFNGALFRASTVEAVGVPDLRLFVRGDEVELHRRLVRSGLPFGTCLDAIYLHPCGTDEFKPILGGRMHTQYPDNADQAVLHLPQSRLPVVAAGPAQAAAAGVVAVRLVLPGVPPRPPRSCRVGTAAQAGQAREVREAMTFTDAAAQSRTMSRARRDLVDGFARRELWAHLGWQDIKQRYRRSVLGPFWITIATGVTAVAMGGLYSKLFKLELSEHLPYVTLGLIIWNLINASILEGADVFIANEGLIKQLPTPLSVHVYRLVWRQILLFAHNIVIFVVIAIIYPEAVVVGRPRPSSRRWA